MGFVLDDVALGCVFLYFIFLCLYFSASAPYSFTYHHRCMILVMDSVVKYHEAVCTAHQHNYLLLLA